MNSICCHIGIGTLHLDGTETRMKINSRLVAVSGGWRHPRTSGLLDDEQNERLKIGAAPDLGYRSSSMVKPL
jgi:hypothetical protein